MFQPNQGMMNQGMAQPGMQGQPSMNPQGYMMNPGMMNNQGMMQGQPGMPMQNTANFGPQTTPMPSQQVGQGNYPTRPQNGVIIRPVASYDEARAIPTDFTGGLLIMPDLGHQAIYTKVLDPNTGSSILKTYKEAPEEAPQPVAPAYDAESEINRLREELLIIKKELGLEEK